MLTQQKEINNSFSQSERYWVKSPKQFCTVDLKKTAIFRFLNKLLINAGLKLRIPRLLPCFLKILINFKNKYPDRGDWIHLSYEQITQYLGCSEPTTCSIIKAAIALKLIECDRKRSIHSYKLNEENLEQAIANPSAYYEILFNLDPIEDQQTIQQTKKNDEYPSSPHTTLDKDTTSSCKNYKFVSIPPALFTISSTSVNLLATNFVSTNITIGTNELSNYPILNNFPKLKNFGLQLKNFGLQLKNLSFPQAETLTEKEFQPISYNQKNPKDQKILYYIRCKFFLFLGIDWMNKQQQRKQSEINAILLSQKNKEAEKPKEARSGNQEKDNSGAADENLKKVFKTGSKNRINFKICPSTEQAIAAFEKAYVELYNELGGNNARGVQMPKPFKLNNRVRMLLDKFDSDRIHTALVYMYERLEQGYSFISNVSGYLNDCIEKWDKWEKNLFSQEGFLLYRRLMLVDWGLIT